MDIYLSGDVRKDKRFDGYVLNPNHYNNFLYFSGVSSIGSGAQYYNIVLDAFDYSGNFIERKASFYDRGTTGGGAGIDMYWNNIGYKYNLYISGSSTQFKGFSGVTTTSNSYDYTSTNQYKFTLNGLPDYTGLTITTATTLFGNVLIKLNEDYRTYNNTFNFVLGATTSLSDYLIPLSGSGVYNISFESYGSDGLEIYDGVDTGGILLYSYSPDYYVITSQTINLTSGNLYFYDTSFIGSGNTINNLEIIKQYSGNNKLMQFNVESESNDFIMDMFLNDRHINRYNFNGVYNEKLDFIDLSPNESWVDFFIRSTDEVRLNNIKLFSIQ